MSKKRWVSSREKPTVSVSALSEIMRTSSLIAFRGTKTLISSLTSSSVSAFSACARRCPSVATMVMDPGLSKSNAPLNVYLESSVLIAKIVRVISFANASDGIFATGDFGSAKAGKSSCGSPAIRKRLEPQVIVTQFASPRLNLISLSGSARTISYNRFAGRVIVPGTVVFETQTDFRPISRSVAAIPSSPLSARTRTFARIGIVVLRSTTP